MSLYLLPPTGTVSFHKLEEYATKRLQFLLRLVACHSKLEVESVLEDADVVDQSECLITHTPKDEISHHILRLTLGGDQESRSFFCDSELALFKLRVENMVADEWTVFFKSADKFLRRMEGSVTGVGHSALSDLRLVIEILKGKFESWYQLSTEICGQTACMSVSLPFQLVLRLVAGRLVSLVRGMAAVPVALLKDVFIELFERLMLTAAHQASVEREWAIRDERIQRLAGTLKGLLKAETKMPEYQPGHFSALKLADLWEHSAMFPPCMENVVKDLQERHTLKHHDRVQLTLFLKALGLPVNDALLLWKREYSVSTKANKVGSCQERWQGNERRYIYNIRHLYGLEGSRTNYRAHNCSAIQNRSLTCGDTGGCPFVSHDIAALKASLLRQEIHKDNTDLILKLCHHKMYGYACQSFMQHKLKQPGKMQSDFIADERHIKVEVENSPKIQVVSSDSNIRTCQEGVQHNGIARKKGRCVTRSSSHICGKMLPYELAEDIVVKFQKNDGTSLSLEKNIVDSNLNLQSETTFLNLPLSPTHNPSICSHWVSFSNGECSVNNQRKHIVYRWKRYLFKKTSKNQIEELVQPEKCSNTSNCDRSVTSKESSCMQLDNDKLNKLVCQQQKLNSDTEAFQDRFLLGSNTFEQPLQAHHSRFSHCSKQAEFTSLVRRKLSSFISDVCEDINVQVDDGIYVPAGVGAASGLVDPGEWLADHVDRKKLSDPSERRNLLDPVKCKCLPNPAKRKLLLDHGAKHLSDPSEKLSDHGAKHLSDPSEKLSDHGAKHLSDPSEKLSDHVSGKQLSNPSEENRLSGPESTWLSDPVKYKQLSYHVEEKQLADLTESKHLPDFLEGKQLSNPNEGTWLLDAEKCKWLSNSVEGKWLSNSAVGKQLSDSTEGKWLSNSVEGKWLSNSAVGKQLSDSTEGKWLSNSAEGKWLSNPGGYKQLSLSAEAKWLSNSAEGKWLSEPGAVKRLVNPGEVGHLSCINTQEPEYQRCTSYYNGFSTLENAQLPSDPLFENNPAGSLEMKPDSKFLCEQNYHEITERKTVNLNPHSLAESAVSIKKPCDIYWFSRDLLQLYN